VQPNNTPKKVCHKNRIRFSTNNSCS